MHALFSICGHVSRNVDRRQDSAQRNGKMTWNSDRCLIAEIIWVFGSGIEVEKAARDVRWGGVGGI